MNSRAYLSRFNFSGSDQNKKVATLSGGERNRLHLAMTLKEEGNVLLLDEPTNDLDVNTLRALEEGLENFAGCAVPSLKLRPKCLFNILPHFIQIKSFFCNFYEKFHIKFKKPCLK